jgi:hypothetical protein
MEHIIQFGVNIDDDAIVRNIESSIQKKVEGAILQDVKQKIVGQENYSNWSYSRRIESLISDAASSFFIENKDRIIELASDKLADKLVKTKAVKEMLSNTINSLL